ncbi:hypothetical protein AG1IA_05813 [Rhizoctonia solani AG-1 IA]|uniref:Uncharacterized protein n=1 Tax=Thanatephorus cucumeris (strain AG1-IA) TaxID=983506 RepID=L8WTR3_THACA|nr:hypothetical protein AG1IA_05813 [Rhizoctonia solani AG-1 IA]
MVLERAPNSYIFLCTRASGTFLLFTIISIHCFPTYDMMMSVHLNGPLLTDLRVKTTAYHSWIKVARVPSRLPINRLVKYSFSHDITADGRDIRVFSEFRSHRLVRPNDTRASSGDADTCSCSKLWILNTSFSNYTQLPGSLVKIKAAEKAPNVCVCSPGNASVGI